MGGWVGEWVGGWVEEGRRLKVEECGRVRRIRTRRMRASSEQEDYLNDIIVVSDFRLFRRHIGKQHSRTLA